MRSATLLFPLLLISCQSNSLPDGSAPSDQSAAIDASAVADAGRPPADSAVNSEPFDLETANIASDFSHIPSDLHSFTPDLYHSSPDLAISHPDLAPLPASGSLAGVKQLLGGLNVLDASTDQGGGVWAVTPSTVYYFAPGHAMPFTYDQRAGLARGQSTWVDTWFDPGTHPVTFSAVAGAASGQAIIGNIGAIADRLQVDSASGAVLRIDNMQVTGANTGPAELPEHIKRVVAVWHVAVDLNGAYHGTAYLGGFHGFYAFHGLTEDCGCLAFEEHQHYISQVALGGGDVRALAFSPEGDVWAGDRDFVQLLPQRSLGPSTGLFDANITLGIDVFPGVRDEVTGLAVDALGGVWVASRTNALAYLPPDTRVPRFFSKELPSPTLSGVLVDPEGDVWVATAYDGLVRYRPSSQTWTRYTAASGLPANEINAIYLDRSTNPRGIVLATGDGIAIYRGP